MKTTTASGEAAMTGGSCLITIELEELEEKPFLRWLFAANPRRVRREVTITLRAPNQSDGYSQAWFILEEPMSAEQILEKVANILWWVPNYPIELAANYVKNNF